MVAIKDMEIPSCCSQCDLCVEDEYADMTCVLLGSDWEETDYNENHRDENCPLVEIEEHKVGKWVKVSETELGIGYQCSECGRFILTESINRRKLEDFPYCHCGAEMRGSENG